MHADQIAAVERVREKAGSKGVEVLPPWLVYHDGVWSGYHEEECDQPCPGVVMWLIDPLTVPFIVTGALAKWLAGQGIAVCQMWDGGGVSWFMYRDGGHGWSALSATDFLSALLAATLARLDELPDAAAEPQPASKEGGR